MSIIETLLVRQFQSKSKSHETFILHLLKYCVQHKSHYIFLNSLFTYVLPISNFVSFVVFSKLSH